MRHAHRVGEEMRFDLGQPEQLELPLTQPHPDEAEIDRAVRGLLAEAMTYRTGPEATKLLRHLGRFTTLAPFNALLLDAQKPGCSYVLPAHAWAEKWGRRVRPGQRPQVILWPFAPVLFVFDVSQVEPIDAEAPELPTAITDPFGMRPVHGVEAALASTIENVKLDGVRVTYTADGSQSAGRIGPSYGGHVVARRTPRSAPAQVRVFREVEISESLDPSGRYATLAHELGHLYCGHVGTIDEKAWRPRTYLSEEAMEIEAEAVAYVACLRLDPSATMPPHLAQYTEPGAGVPPIDLAVVTRAAGRVIDLYESPETVWQRFRSRSRSAAR